MITADVVVIGGGPAGAWCARTLAQGGARVVVLHHEANARSTVELLSGRARWLLRDLSLVGVDVRETRSRWDGDETRIRDAIFDPYGAGLAIERRVLDAKVREAAVDAGATVLAHRAVRVELVDGRWRIDDAVEAGQLVIASGHRSPGPRRAALVAMKQVVSFARYREHEERGLCIERLPTGWLYSLPVPQNGRFVGVCSERPLGMDECVRESYFERGFAGKTPLARWTGVAMVRVFDAVVGTSWIAIGNAAFQPDPLCGEGLWFALETAREAAAVILGSAGRDAFAGWIGRAAQDHMVSRARILGVSELGGRRA